MVEDSSIIKNERRFNKMPQTIIIAIVVLIGSLFYVGIGCILTAMLSCNNAIQSIACMTMWPVVLAIVVLIFIRVNVIDVASTVCRKVYHRVKLIFTCRQ